MDRVKFKSSIKFAQELCKLPFQLKDKQLECISHILEKHDTIGILPTGYGKTVIFTLLPFVLDHFHDKPKGHTILIVVSPLQALMEEHIMKINDMGVSAVYVGSKKLTDEQTDGIEKGRYQILMLSPESLFAGRWKGLAATDVYRERVSVIAVDEAHCVVTWGAEFRRDYSRLGEIRAMFANATILALTASAPPSMLPEIKKSLSLGPDTQIISHSANRQNIMYIVKEAPSNITDTFHWVAEELQTHRQQCPKFIIYCRSIKAVGQLFTYFNDELGDSIYVGKKFSGNCLVAMFTHPTKQRYKDMVAGSFGKEDSNIRVVLATIAFGMGIDCPDVKTVINWGASRTFEGFYQESGRAGRNPTIQAYSIVYYQKANVTTLATDDNMRAYCYGKERAVEQSDHQKSDEEDSDIDIEDIFGTILDIGDKPQVKTVKCLSKPALEFCRRKFLCDHLTPNMPSCPPDPIHFCCDLCVERCACQNCPDIPGVNLGRYVTDEALLSAESNIEQRSVSKSQKQQLLTGLEKLRDNSPKLFGGAFQTGLDDYTIKQIVRNAETIFQDSDLRAHLHDPGQISAVMSVVRELFGSD